MESHLLQMRGLKLKFHIRISSIHKSHLLQMRGLKPYRIIPRSIYKSRIFYRCVD